MLDILEFTAAGDQERFRLVLLVFSCIALGHCDHCVYGTGHSHAPAFVEIGTRGVGGEEPAIKPRQAWADEPVGLDRRTYPSTDSGRLGDSAAPRYQRNLDWPRWALDIYAHRNSE